MEKGQLFSLDFLVSVIAATAAIALLLQAVEVRAYSQQEEMLNAELQQVAENAADLLVSSPDMVCELTNNTKDEHVAYLQNCVPKIDAMGERISKEKMGIPAGYACKLENSVGGTLNTEDCLVPGQEIPDVSNWHSVKRKIVFYSKGTGAPAEKRKVTKQQLEICMGNEVGTCDLDESEITLWVWKE